MGVSVQQHRILILNQKKKKTHAFLVISFGGSGGDQVGLQVFRCGMVAITHACSLVLIFGAMPLVGLEAFSEFLGFIVVVVGAGMGIDRFI